ncbi:DddA-like double-stranded DNA deaminase toxin [Plantactinospora solaniradicis]|uniref:DddA-like double-stranded DNA deaminase toxin n=1 Tax=Plantactinospora solaniradicis TaxID=1723736 RepID=A0ABW1KM71_9ACTN
MSLLTDAHGRLQRADSALSQALASVTLYISAVGADPPAVDVGQVANRSWPSLASSSPGGPVPGFVARAAEQLQELLPRGVKTVGMLATSDGAVRSKPVWSGEEGPAAGAPGLRRDSPRRWHQNAAATQHVEGHVAAIMRRPEGPRHAVLVVSKRPCPGELGCHRLLPELLPKGATLTVYVAGKDASPRLWKTYLGTGEGVPT